MSSATPRPRLLALAPSHDGPALAEAVEGAGMTLVASPGLTDFLRELSGGGFAATLLSLGHDAVDEALARRVGDQPGKGILLLSTPRMTLESALLMEQAGALALLHEPLSAEELAGHLQGVLDEGETVPIPEPTPTAEGVPVLVGSDPVMGKVLQSLVRVAATPSTVLLHGESGTGKEVAARVLHWASPRRDEPFVAVNCAAIPEHLLESELFGHERGAFTGAVGRRVGRFERADGGTLFLDEIGDMSLVLQAKVLRVLEERRFERVGGNETVSVDVRVVTATHRDLRARVAGDEFREDLYYRLAVVELELPPLRERGDDLRELALHFAGHFAARYDRPVRGITEAALRRLAGHGWPGNVRELRNVLDRAVVLAGGEILRAGDLRLGAASPRTSPLSPAAADPFPATLSLAEVEAAHIRKVLAAEEGHMGRAAQVLGIHRNTLTRKVREYGLEGGAEA